MRLLGRAVPKVVVMCAPAFLCVIFFIILRPRKKGPLIIFLLNKYHRLTPFKAEPPRVEEYIILYIFLLHNVVSSCADSSACTCLVAVCNNFFSF